MSEVDAQVRFLQNSRYGDWKKGDLGTVSKVLVTPPQNLNTIVIVRIDNREVWATDLDFERYDQLTLF